VLLKHDLHPVLQLEAGVVGRERDPGAGHGPPPFSSLPQPLLRQSSLHLHYYATVNLVVAHPAGNTVGVFQLLNRIVNFDFAVAGELQALGEVQPGADNRPAGRFPHQNRLKVQLK
jgi:hypothetical protein